MNADADLTLLVRPEPWMVDAACRGRTAVMFDESRVAEATAICARCPVIGPCSRLAAVLGPSVQGVWAGEVHGSRERLEPRRLPPLPPRVEGRRARQPAAKVS